MENTIKTVPYAFPSFLSISRLTLVLPHVALHGTIRPLLSESVSNKDLPSKALTSLCCHSVTSKDLNPTAIVIEIGTYKGYLILVKGTRKASLRKDRISNVNTWGIHFMQGEKNI